ncbi:MAG TPA: hypothetical protein VMV10_09610 [Pirellulales bacterium]|nr:hypothetical protein [Pirellulales bacterium]
MARSFVNLYMAPELVCYDGEIPPIDPPKMLTQAEFDKALAADKRAHQAQYQRLEQQLQSTLENAKLTGEERTKLEESLEGVRKQLRTKEEQAKVEKKKLEEDFTGKISAAEQRAVTAEKKWQDSTIEQALRDAASAGDAFNADIVVTVLRSQTKLVDDKPMVDFISVDPETGESTVLQMAPREAVKKMKEDAPRYGNLFKSGVVGGIGGSGGAGALPNGGRVNIKDVPMDQYMKLRKENPAALGLA